MKKFLFYFACIVAIIGILFTVTINIAIGFVGKNIDYEMDEKLFNKAREDDVTSYYAYNQFNQLTEVWKSFGAEKREWIQLGDVNEYLVKGFIAVEDRHFFNHNGINIKRTAAAILNHIFRFQSAFGASTITQQVIKNVSGDKETTVKRKINEIFRALNLERNHSKEEILEVYLNIVPMSDNIYGVSLAAEVYFGKPASDLSITEAATIIGITNAPAKYNPYTNPQRCQEKRNRVLYAMKDCGLIDHEEYEKAISSSLDIKSNSKNTAISSWFVETARDDIVKDLSNFYNISDPAARLMLKGASVILTMSPEIQKIMEEFFENTDKINKNSYDKINYAMVVSEPKTGNLLGIIGNSGKKEGERLYNHATSRITPGSTIKPLSIYAPLLDSRDINWSTIVKDEPVRYIANGDEEIPYPRNSPDVYNGDITIEDAIKRSKNTVSIKLLEKLGVEKSFNLLKNIYGFSDLVDRVVCGERVLTDMAEAPLGLGQLTQGVSLRKLTESYNVFPAEGNLRFGSSYYSVTDRDGKVIIEPSGKSVNVMKKTTADIMNQMLANVVKDGTARRIKLKETVDTAGKTGTSGKDKDRLFIGYTPYCTAGIWCGCYDGVSNIGVYNPNHLEIWDEIMTKIHNEIYLSGYEENQKSFDTSDLILQPYCSISGGLLSEACEMDDATVIKYGYFSKDNSLDKICNVH